MYVSNISKFLLYYTFLSYHSFLFSLEDYPFIDGVLLTLTSTNVYSANCIDFVAITVNCEYL